MRVQPWIVSILSVMALSVGQSGFAQYEGFGELPPQAGSGAPYYPAGQFPPSIVSGGPGGEGFVPPPPPAPAGAWDPIAAGQNGGPGYHPDRLPWPHITPFENQFAEHTHENELWYFRSDNSGRKYFANLDYRRANYRRPDVTRVGFETRVEPDFILANPTAPNAPFYDYLPVDTGVFFSSYLGNRGTINTIAVNEQHGDSEPTVNGFNLDWGYFDPDRSGLMVGGWYTPDASWSYSRGFNPPQADVLTAFNQATALNMENGQPLVITNAIQLNDGSRDGVSIQFDKFFGLSYESVGGGGELDWLFSPFWKSEWYEFAPTMGVQFTYIGEKFGFRGLDSGLYTLPAPNTTLIITQTVAGGAVFGPVAVQESGTLTQFISGINPGFLVATAPYEMQILSEVDSYLFGPQVGMRFQFGGDNLRILGKSNIGFAANHERITLSSFGVGNPDVQDGNPGRGIFFPPNPLSGPNPIYDPNTRFREEQTTTKLSPTTSHEVTAEMNIFQFIPVINKIHWMQEAKLRVGYQINMAFEIQRPHRTIEYNGFPLIPAIRNDQETRWYVQSYNFGIHWDY